MHLYSLQYSSHVLFDLVHVELRFVYLVRLCALVVVVVAKLIVRILRTGRTTERLFIFSFL